MRVRVLPEPNVSLLDRQAKELACADTTLLLFLAEAGWSIPELDAWARAQTLTVVGGIFPRAIGGRQLIERGGVLVALQNTGKSTRVPLTASPQIPGDLPDARAYLVLLDGLAPHIQPVIEALYDELGVGKTFLGGGAGSLSLTQGPCVISNAGVNQNEAIVLPLNSNPSLGVRHGWQPLYPDLILQATETDGNVIHTLNWEPAFVVYRRLVEPHVGVAITPENFFEVAKAYPLGLLRPGDEFIVRDPIKVEGQSLVCVGAVRPNSTLMLLHGNLDSLLTAADELGKLGGLGAHGRLVFDCISRVLFLGEAFAEELRRLVPDDVPSAGALTLGEVSGSPRSRLAFCNKTSVMAAW